MPTTWRWQSGSSLCRQAGFAGCCAGAGVWGSGLWAADVFPLHGAGLGWLHMLHHGKTCVPVTFNSRTATHLPPRLQGYQAGGGARRSASAGGGAALDPADLEAGAVVGK